MERLGKFVVREDGAIIAVYRIIGYDFERQKCIMKRVSPLHNNWNSFCESEDFSVLKDTDALFSADEVIARLNQFVEEAENAVCILSALEKGACPKWVLITKHINYRTEFSHLYNALNNTLCNLHHYKKYTSKQAYRDYTKSLRNLRKRFYFYYGDEGKNFVDFMLRIADNYENSIKDKRESIQNNVRRKQILLSILNDYITRVPEIRYT